MDTPKPPDDDVAARLDMRHLREEKERVDREFEAASKPAEPAEAEEFPAELCKPEATFTIDYTSPAGKRYYGEFTNRILTVGQKIKVDVVRARRMLGAPREAMTDSIMGLLLMVTWMEESLVSRPKWAEDLLSIREEVLVESAFEKIAEHERCFHRRAKIAEGG